MYVYTCLKYTSCKATYKMFVFIKKVFHIGSLFLSSLVSTTPLSCISMNNQACKVRPEIVNVNSNEPVFYPFSIKTSKCSGSWVESHFWVLCFFVVNCLGGWNQ